MLLFDEMAVKELRVGAQNISTIILIWVIMARYRASFLDHSGYSRVCIIDPKGLNFYFMLHMG